MLGVGPDIAETEYVIIWAEQVMSQEYSTVACDGAGFGFGQNMVLFKHYRA